MSTKVIELVFETPEDANRIRDTVNSEEFRRHARAMAQGEIVHLVCFNEEFFTMALTLALRLGRMVKTV